MLERHTDIGKHYPLSREKKPYKMQIAVNYKSFACLLRIDSWGNQKLIPRNGHKNTNIGRGEGG